MKRCFSWYPVELFDTFGPPPSPTLITLPVGSTKSKLSTRSRECPYLEPISDHPLVPIRPPTSEHGYDAGSSG